MLSKFSLMNILLCGLLLYSAQAFGQEDEEVDEEKAAYAKAVVAGHEAMLKNEYTEAVSAYSEAKELDPGNADSFYFLACAHMAAGDVEKAEEDFKTAINVAGSKRHDVHAKCLFNLAYLEESKKAWEDAKKAWDAYIAFAGSHQDIPVYVENAKARIKAIDDAKALDEKYQAVRKRIADREAINKK